MKQPFVPRNEILHYCEHIMNAHIQTLRKKNKKTWYWDYPAMAAICHNRGCTLKRASFSHYPYKNEYHPVLERKLLELGEIGKKCTSRRGWRCVIGNCAEQHAANLFMKHFNENDLNHLFFSEAMRPRTKQVFDYCDNCKDTFPNL